MSFEYPGFASDEVWALYPSNNGEESDECQCLGNVLRLSLQFTSLHRNSIVYEERCGTHRGIDVVIEIVQYIPGIIGPNGTECFIPFQQPVFKLETGNTRAICNNLQQINL